MKPNILMISGDAGIARGNKNVFYEMLREFSKYFNTVHVITGSNDVGKTMIVHNNVYIHPSDKSKFLRLDFWTHADFVYKKAIEINMSYPLDMVASHVIPPFFPGTKAAMKISETLGIPHFAEVMHIPGYPAAGTLMETFERIRVKAFLKKNHKKFYKIRIINRNETKNFLVDLGIPESSLLEIPCFYLDFNAFRLYPEIKRKKDQFVYSGRFDRNKNIYSILKAFKAINEDYPKATLKLIGDGHMRPQIEKFIEKNGVRNVDLLGWFKVQTDVAKIYAESTALVMASFSEGGPRVTLEAMACGALVLSTPVGIMKEVIEDFRNSIMLNFSSKDVEEKMRFVLENPEKAKDIAHRGMQRVKEFEYHKAIGHYAKSYIFELN